MDLITHAVVGYFVGGPAGIAGAVCSDLPMIKYALRIPGPTDDSPPFYAFTHSLVFVLIGLFAVGPGFAAGIFTHIFLDEFTHGDRFTPRWFFPFPWHSVGRKEWYFLSETWWKGLVIALCLILGAQLYTVIGYRS